MMSWIGLHKHGFCPHPPSPPTYSLKWRGDLIWKFAKILWVQHFFLNLWGEKPLWGELIFYGGVIFISPISLFYFFRNSQHPEKWSVSVKNFFRKCECISSCYLPISSILLKNSPRKTLLFVLFELLPTGLLKYLKKIGIFQQRFLFLNILSIDLILSLSKHFIPQEVFLDC